MAEPEKPIAVLELGDGQSTSFHVLRAETFEGFTIFPAHAPAGKAVTVLRLHVPPGDKPFPPWWDITQSKLIARLRGVLPLLEGTGRRVRITAFGFPPKKDFTVDIEAA